MINRVELIMRRRVVKAFIKADVMPLVLTRELPAVKNPETGGYVRASGDPSVLDPQDMRIIQNVRRYTDGLVNAEAGDIPNTEYRLLAEWNADIEEDDTFIWEGEHYYVSGIHEARDESIFASIDLLGKRNRNG